MTAILTLRRDAQQDFLRCEVELFAGEGEAGDAVGADLLPLGVPVGLRLRVEEIHPAVSGERGIQRYAEQAVFELLVDLEFAKNGRGFGFWSPDADGSGAFDVEDAAVSGDGDLHDVRERVLDLSVAVEITVCFENYFSEDVRSRRVFSGSAVEAERPVRNRMTTLNRPRG